MVTGYCLTVVREPRDDEQYVMGTYEKHLSHCLRCVYPTQTKEREYALCNRGYKYARDVANYLFAQGGKCFSVVASERGRRVQVKIPRDAQGICSLLMAIEDGLKLCSENLVADVQSYQIRQQQPNTSQIPSRSQLQRLKTYKIIERRPRQADHQALSSGTLCQHTERPPLQNTDCIVRSKSRIRPRGNYWVVERYPRERF